eukprot:TRINITY_DN26917_c0_g1_i2.p1 TRINITY_DN26917_c0_g1~~TRINITY_DN26917_c0_g1_i2.p1  ORF type:complete len:552 (-),score=69.14 TRINITY_DN26917_c0_g1_i2:16-1671(-)
MSALGLSQNVLDGTIPPFVAKLTQIEYLGLSQNSFSGTIPPQISNLANLTALLVDTNRFDGAAPSFRQLRRLVNLTLFANELKGRLWLPSSDHLRLLLAQTNRLSCPIGTDNTTVAPDRNLVLPGNLFSAPVPSWLGTSGVRFLYYISWWDTWNLALMSGAVMLCCSAAILLVLGRDGLMRLLRSTHDTVWVRLQMSKWLCVWSGVWVPPTVGLYYSGANLYECGKPWLYTTAAYLDADSTVEWLLAAAACLGSGLAAYSVRALDSYTMDTKQLSENGSTNVLPIRKRLLLWGVWVPVSLALSVPTAMYIVSTSVPPRNTLGLSSVVLAFFQRVGAPALYGVSALVVPPLARWGVNKVCGAPQPHTTVKLMIVARLIVALVVPCMFVLLLNQDCFALWLRVWEPCADEGRFEISTALELEGQHVTIPATSQREVCSPPYQLDGRCPRAVVGTVGDLLLDKMIFTASFGPTRTILLSFPTARMAREWVAHKLLRRTSYRASTDPVSYTHLRAHETPEHLVCRLLLEKKKKTVSISSHPSYTNTLNNKHYDHV